MSTETSTPRPAVLTPTRIELLHPKVVEILRAKSPSQRLEMVAEANRSLRVRTTSAIAQQHPDWTAAQVQAEFARRILRGSK